MSRKSIVYQVAWNYDYKLFYIPDKDCCVVLFKTSNSARHYYFPSFVFVAFSPPSLHFSVVHCCTASTKFKWHLLKKKMQTICQNKKKWKERASREKGEGSGNVSVRHSCAILRAACYLMCLIRASWWLTSYTFFSWLRCLI